MPHTEHIHAYNGIPSRHENWQESDEFSSFMCKVGLLVFLCLMRYQGNELSHE